MPLRIKCPTGHVLIVPDNRVGKELRCPRCDQPFIVPAVDKKLSLKTGKVPTGSSSSSSLDLGNLALPSPPPPAPVAAPPAADIPLPVKFPLEGRNFPPRKPAAETSPKPTAPPSRTAAPVSLPSPANNAPSPPPSAANQPSPPPLPPPPPTPPSPSPAAPVEPIAALPAVAGENLPTGEVAPASEQPDPLPVPEPPPAHPPADAGQTPPLLPATPSPPPQAAAGTQISLAPRKLPVKPPASAPPHAEPPSDLPATPSEKDALNPAAELPPTPPAPPVQPLAATTEPGTEESPPRHGVIHGRDKLLVVYQLAAAMIAAGLFSMVPAVWDVLEHLTIPESQHVARWAFLLLTLGLLQLAYCVYLIQLPDWASVWVMTLFALAMAALYAMVFGLTLIASTDGAIVRALQLGDKVAGGQAALWCLCMASLFTLLAFFAGRTSVRWHRAELVLHSAGLAPVRSR